MLTIEPSNQNDGFQIFYFLIINKFVLMKLIINFSRLLINVLTKLILVFIETKI